MGRPLRASLAAFAWCVACSNYGASTPDQPTTDGGGGGGDDAGLASDGAPPPGCDPSLEPRDAPACVVDEYAIFVSPNGSGSAPGTRNAPVPTVAIAMLKRSGRPRIYVCEGTYSETLAITDAVSVYGGFACDWSYSGKKAKVAGLRIAGVGGDVVVADLDFAAPNATVPGGSSIAGFISQASAVTLRRVSLTAGNGTDGADGVTITNTPPGSRDGQVASMTQGGLQKTCACVDGTSSTGGRGGVIDGQNAADGSANPALGAANHGGNNTTSCSAGQKGQTAIATGTPGAGATSPGALTITGWGVGTAATAGGAGHPGQGGGGGGAILSGPNAYSGGGGACGGCGGGGGGAGQNGGSSFALLSYQSVVHIDDSTLTAANAGRGGSGGPGGSDVAGGIGGTSSTSGCAGGDGGSGSGGSGGGGGAGGHSIAIGYVGVAPSTGPTAKLVSGTSGKGGIGGGPGGVVFGAPGGKGSDGVAAASQSFP